MEDLIGFLIFAAIAGIGALSKYAESKKAERERQNRPVVKPEDLPEATRRMLYGESGVPPRPGQRPGHDIPTARRKAAVPPSPPRPPMPPREGPRTAPAEGPLMRQGSYPTEQPYVRGEETSSPVFSEEQRIEELRRKLQQKLQQQWVQEQRKKTATQQAARPKPPAAPRSNKLVRTHPKAPVAVAPEHREGAPSPEEGPHRAFPQHHEEATASRRPPAAAMVKRIFHNPRALRQAVILQEVLGTPVGLR